MSVDPDINPDVIVAALGGLNQWARQCHAASIHLVQSGVLGTARVARGTCHGVPAQHSWVVLAEDCYQPDALVVDPTLWSYDTQVQGVWIGRASERPHLPHGSGSIWTWGQPASGGEAPIILATPISREAQSFLDLLGPLDITGWMMLFNAPVGGWPSAEIITAAWHTSDLRALIPIDRVGMLTNINPNGLYLNGPELPQLDERLSTPSA